jgi:hypothetical protein
MPPRKRKRLPDNVVPFPKDLDDYLFSKTMKAAGLDLQRFAAGIARLEQLEQRVPPEQRAEYKRYITMFKKLVRRAQQQEPPDVA